jgi:hypothetical protein
MFKITTVGLNLPKNVFKVLGADGGRSHHQCPFSIGIPLFRFPPMISD